ncbi:MAG: TRAP transporter small permease [Thiothrix sp.]|nr:TRAP transporter small permease [Thiothrix sp.]HPQ94168.1 TRAP transporter small permease [Thiolinea sp.]
MGEPLSAGTDEPPARVVLLGLWLRRLLGTLSALVLSALMLLIPVDALGRVLFSTPVPGRETMSAYLLAALIFLGLPLVTAKAGHVTLRLLETRLPPGLRRYQEQSVGLLGTLAFATLSGLLWQHAMHIRELQDTTAVLQLPFFWLVLLMALSSGLSAALLALMLLTGRRHLIVQDNDDYQA